MHISADVQRITLNATCITISGRRTEQLDIIAGFLPRYWLCEWFSQFYRCGSYSVLSRIPSIINTICLRHKYATCIIFAITSAKLCHFHTLSAVNFRNDLQRKIKLFYKVYFDTKWYNLTKVILVILPWSTIRILSVISHTRTCHVRESFVTAMIQVNGEMGNSTAGHAQTP